jgi:hypothetical protein
MVKSSVNIDKKIGSQPEPAHWNGGTDGETRKLSVTIEQQSTNVHSDGLE